jgi:methionyl-tRNA synthetase
VSKRPLSTRTADFVQQHALMPLKALDHTCPHCEYDEAEGGLVNHCDVCCRKIVGELLAYREGLRSRLQQEKRARHAQSKKGKRK